MFNVLGYLSLFNNWPSVILATIVAIYFFSNRYYNYWKYRGVNGPKPLPLIGNLYSLFYKPRAVQMVEDYKKFGKIYGIYEGLKPVLMVAEPELIRNIFIKDFDKFVDRGLPPFGTPMFDRSLINAKGDHWKHIRMTVSPTFSSGKLRKMQKLLDQCVERLDTALTKIAKSSDNQIVLRQIIGNYSMDVIALVAFATKIDTYGSDIHPFVKNAQTFFTPSLRVGLFFLGTSLMPSVIKKYNLSLVPKSVISYFHSTLKSIISERDKQQNDGKYVDFLQLLLDEKKRTDNKDIDDDIKREVEMIGQSLKKKTKYELEDIDIMATSMFFILAGSETTSTAISHLFHELALNPKIQQKLFEEISGCNGNLDYDTIGRLTYLDACVNETLRKYPAVVFQQRTATEDYDLGDTGLRIPKGMAIRIPMYAMHHDPKLFENPEQFNPNRFMPENKSQIIPYSYIPFGNGPRNCVGMRFALMNVKTAVAKILAKFQFIQTENTKTVFVLKKFIVFPQAIDMGKVGLRLRN